MTAEEYADSLAGREFQANYERRKKYTKENGRKKDEQTVDFIGEKKNYDQASINVITELNQFDITPDPHVNSETLPEYVKELQVMYKMRGLNKEPSSPDIDIICDELMQKMTFKTFGITREILYYDGKIYRENGELKILEDLEMAQVNQRKKLVQLNKIGETLDGILFDTKSDKSELLKYQYALTQRIVEEKTKLLKIRKAVGAEVINKIGNRTFVDREEFSADPNTLVIDNGVLNFNFKKIKVKNKIVNDMSWTLREHSPDVLSLNMVQVEFDPKATCPNFIRFLRQTYQYDKKATTNVIKMLGYLLYRSCKFQVIFLLYGDGDNGKSVELEVINRFLGIDNTVAIALQDVCGENRFVTARLFGKMANIYADIPPNKIVDTSKIKVIASGDRMSGENKNQKPFDFYPYAKQIFSMNRIPESNDKSFGYYKRLVMIPHNTRIPKNKQDINLIDKLTTPKELSGILNLALCGLRMLFRDNGFENTDNVDQIRKEYEEQSILVNGFVARYYEIDVGNESEEYWTTTRQVQNEFSAYLKNNLHLTKYIVREALDDTDGEFDRQIDVDNKINQLIIDQLLGKQLAALGIDKKRRLKETFDKGSPKEFCYVGMKSKLLSRNETNENNDIEDALDPDKEALEKYVIPGLD